MNARKRLGRKQKKIRPSRSITRKFEIMVDSLDSELRSLSRTLIISKDGSIRIRGDGISAEVGMLKGGKSFFCYDSRHFNQVDAYAHEVFEQIYLEIFLSMLENNPFALIHLEDGIAFHVPPFSYFDLLIDASLDVREMTLYDEKGQVMAFLADGAECNPFFFHPEECEA